MRAIALWTVVAATLAFPAGALAVKCAPPGTSGVDQYLETIPGAACNAPFVGTGGRGGGVDRLAPSVARALQAQGNAGIAVERLVASTGTAGELAVTTGRRQAGTSSLARATPGAAGPSGGPRTGDGSFASALSGLSGSGGTADRLLLPVLVAAALLFAVGITVARRRHGRRSK